jgi:hypothetical protein
MNDYHTKVSLIKSGVRVVGYYFLLINLGVAVVLLLVSELLGIIEEIKWK